MNTQMLIPIMYVVAISLSLLSFFFIFASELYLNVIIIYLGLGLISSYHHYKPLASITMNGYLQMLQLSQHMSEINHFVGHPSTTMNEVHVESDKINDVVSIFGEIANQTNLLFLNASIEATKVH